MLQVLARFPNLALLTISALLCWRGFLISPFPLLAGFPNLAFFVSIRICLTAGGVSEPRHDILLDKR